MGSKCKTALLVILGAAAGVAGTLVVVTKWLSEAINF